MDKLNYKKVKNRSSVEDDILDSFMGSEDDITDFNPCLKKSEEMDFLKETESRETQDSPFWSLYSQDNKLEPLKFSNGKTQEDVVKEIVDLIKSGNKIIFLRGVCGTGKSAIALNIARILGKTSLVVPVKGLQRQYEEDYTSKKYLIKKNGQKMKIAMITGRNNHDSIIQPGVSCADLNLPDTIRITEKNYEKIREYYEKNPFIRNKELPEIRKLKRIAIAPANPYWSPIRPADFELSMLRDAKKLKYRGLRGKDFIFYHRKPGCSYYDQYLAYLYADAIIFNSAKYKIEVALDRKPETEVDIIDEADEFLDNFSMQESLNLTRFATSLKSLSPEHPEAQEAIREISELLYFEEKNKQALGIDENRIFHINETKLEKMFKLLLKNSELASEILIDELNYSNKALEVAEIFNDFLDETYLTFRRYEKDLYVELVSTNLSKRFREIIDKSKALVLMSGTLHSPKVLEDVFGLKDFKIVNAETLHPGTIEIHKTGKELDCRYSSLNSNLNSRTKYLQALYACFQKAAKPVLIHVNAFEDLPTEQEIIEDELFSFISRETLREMQYNDKTGKMISEFKDKKSPFLFTTKCSRGVDFPGDTCNSIIFTKYPNPNIQEIFWKLLQKEHPNYYWEFYRDKARREFLQRIYRALRFKEDHVYVLSPDSRVLDAVRNLQYR
jgi:Rad3-related DNA helicase